MIDYDILMEYKNMCDALFEFDDYSSEIKGLDERMRMELVEASSIQKINDIKKRYCLLRCEMIQNVFDFIESYGLLSYIKKIEKLVKDYKFVFTKYKLCVNTDNLPLMIAANSFYLDSVINQARFLSQEGKKGIL